MSNLLQQLNNGASSVVEKVQSSLVQVHNAGGGSGAGTIWHPQGLVITNAHVIQRHEVRVVLPDGRSLPARILARDPERDLAALVVDAVGLPAIELGDSRLLRPGQWVLALGHPNGIHNAVTAGVFIDGRAGWGDRSKTGREFIAVSLHLRPGYSGGPLVDVDGRLVGINTMMNGLDVGLAVPVHVVKTFLRQRLAAPKAVA